MNLTNDQALYAVHSAIPAILTVASFCCLLYLGLLVFRTAPARTKPSPRSASPPKLSIINFLLIGLVACESVQILFTTIHNSVCYSPTDTQDRASIFSSLSLVVVGFGQSFYLGFAYVRSIDIIRKRVSVRTANMFKITVYVTAALLPLPGFMLLISSFVYTISTPILEAFQIVSVATTAVLDTAFMYCFTAHIRTINATLDIDPKLLIIAWYGVVSCGFAFASLASFAYAATLRPQDGWQFVLMRDLVDVFVFGICATCLWMKVSLMRVQLHRQTEDWNSGQKTGTL
ncbi:hypothetical protein BJ741DRAFT_616962 [Chytriomyces cf. hyalinus JEL632]|nr:hypothetical protein BJ741DRAFT_616962 [Chytriomyces cf. hyalinus JEL632]